MTKKVSSSFKSYKENKFFWVSIILLLVILPLAVSLAQKNQENRSNAAAVSGGVCDESRNGKTVCIDNRLFKCIKSGKNYRWVNMGSKCENTPYNLEVKPTVALNQNSSCNAATIGSSKCMSDGISEARMYECIKMQAKCPGCAVIYKWSEKKDDKGNGIACKETDKPSVTTVPNSSGTGYVDGSGNGIINFFNRLRGR